MDSNHVLSDALRAHVYELAGKIGERNVLRPRALAAARDYVRGRFGGYGYDVRSQPYEIEGSPFENLIASRPGAGPGRIVVGAHYDTAPATPGADDNASGVAGLLELSRLLRCASPRKTLEFVAFSTEEPPFFGTRLMGSEFYAAEARRRGDPIEGMVCLEMIGFYSREAGLQTYPPFLSPFFPARADFIGLVGNLRSRRLLGQVRDGLAAHAALPLIHATLPAFVPGVDLSDHRSFWRQGYPAVMLTDTSFYRNANYHQPTDTPETLDYASMAALVAGLAKTLEMLQ